MTWLCCYRCYAEKYADHVCQYLVFVILLASSQHRYLLHGRFIDPHRRERPIGMLHITGANTLPR